MRISCTCEQWLFNNETQTEASMKKKETREEEEG